MNTERSPSPQQAAEHEPEDNEDMLGTGPGVGPIPPQHHPGPSQDEQMRNRSPTPPKALFRSTTGKGVAFTDEDVNFLVRFMEYRKWVTAKRLLSCLMYTDFVTDRRVGLTWLHFGRTWLPKWDIPRANRFRDSHSQLIPCRRRITLARHG
jgi:hypothetical protein